MSFPFFKFLKIIYWIFIFREGEGREKEMERNINVWLPLTHSLLGTWPTTQACDLLGIEQATLWFACWCSIHWATPARATFLTLKVSLAFHLYPGSIEDELLMYTFEYLGLWWNPCTRCFTCFQAICFVFVYFLEIKWSITIILIFPTFFSSAQPTPCSHSESLHHCACPWVIHTCSLTSLFPFFPPLSPSPFPSGHCQSRPCQ